jgi:dTDP-4-dehydrorhamnose reductase
LRKRRLFRRFFIFNSGYVLKLMKILLLGKNGQVGWELQRALAPLGTVVALDRRGLPGLCGDLADLSGLAHAVRTLKPDVIVNAAAYTAVDKAESEQALASCLNTDAPLVLAQEAKTLGALMVHYSTDYVFDGRGHQPWQETDVPSPLNVYGQSKLAGERAIVESGCRHLIFRTSWVYAARGGNFAKTMLRLAGERERLTVINDQFGAPTSAELIADVSAHAIRSVQSNPALLGVYHLVASGETTWHGYAQWVIEFARQAGVPIKVAESNICAVPTTDFPTPALRPLNSRLATDKLRSAFNLTLPDWQQGVERMLQEVLNP